MNSRSSSKPGTRVEKSKHRNSGIVEQSKDSMLNGLMAITSPALARRERRKGHQIISTATYYQAERRRSDNYAQDEADDWLVGGMEMDDGLREGDM